MNNEQIQSKTHQTAKLNNKQRNSLFSGNQNILMFEIPKFFSPGQFITVPFGASVYL